MAKHKIDRALMKDLESRTFDSFGELAIYLRESVAHMKREELGRAMGYKYRSGGAFIQQVENNTRRQSPGMIAGYAQYFNINLLYICNIEAIEIRRQSEKDIIKRRHDIHRFYNHYINE